MRSRSVNPVGVPVSFSPARELVELVELVVQQRATIERKSAGALGVGDVEHGRARRVRRSRGRARAGRARSTGSRRSRSSRRRSSEVSRTIPAYWRRFATFGTAPASSSTAVRAAGAPRARRRCAARRSRSRVDRLAALVEVEHRRVDRPVVLAVEVFRAQAPPRSRVSTSCGPRAGSRRAPTPRPRCCAAARASGRP